jgi:hypothetical protein
MSAVDGDGRVGSGGDREVLLAEIGRVLGMGQPFREWPAPERWWRPERPDATPEPPDGVAVDVLGGVVDDRRDRVAWVERHITRPDRELRDEGWVTVKLNVAGDDVPDLRGVRVSRFASLPRSGARISVPLAEDRADRITAVPYLRFLDGLAGDALVVVYSKIGHKYVCRVTFAAPGLYGIQLDRVALDSSSFVVDEGAGSGFDVTLYHLSQRYDGREGLLYGLGLSNFAPRTPIPVPAVSRVKYASTGLRHGPAGSVEWVEHRQNDLADGTVGEERVVRLRLPAFAQQGFVLDPGVLWDRLRAALAAPDVPSDGPDILIGAVATPFWDASGPWDMAGRSWPWRTARGPWWFPAAWYHYLRSPTADEGAGAVDEAAAWLHCLDQLAAGDDPDASTGWDPAWDREEGLVRLALVHLRRQAGVIGAACRAGGLPLRGDRGNWSSPQPVSAFPAGFGRAWRRLPDRFRPGRLPTVGDYDT